VIKAELSAPAFTKEIWVLKRKIHGCSTYVSSSKESPIPSYPLELSPHIKTSVVFLINQILNLTDYFDNEENSENGNQVEFKRLSSFRRGLCGIYR